MKKISHEEARKIMQVLESDDIVSHMLMRKHKEMACYITQQEKDSKLLNLYRKWFLAKTTKEQDDITNQIVELEKELEITK